MHRAAAADCEKNRLIRRSLQGFQLRATNRDIRNAEVARQQLHVREGVSGACSHNAGNRWQLGGRLTEEVDAVAFERFCVQIPAVPQYTTGEPGIEGP